MPTPDLPQTSPRRWPWAVPLVLALAGIAVYSGSFGGPFVFDDTINIVENDAVQNPTADKLYHQGGRRVIAFTSFALNEVVHDTWAPGYRATNVAIHILAAIVLFDLVRLTLVRTKFGEDFADAVVPAAFCAALVWVVHPLATQAVTYIVQRMESLASLFYLASLWGLARGATASRGWLLVSLACCWLGMATKETAATLPLAALLYDRIFLAASWREVARRRWAYYLAMAPSAYWLASSSLAAFGTGTSGGATVGVNIAEATPLAYLQTQAAVVLHYLRLVVWPVGQCVDYAWPMARQPSDWLAPAIVTGGALIATLVLLCVRPRIGYLPAMFFLVLAPSSSVIPVRDAAVEHRMYLPLAIVIVGIVLLVFALAERLLRTAANRQLRWALLLALFSALAVVLSGVTFARNRVYLAEESLWTDVIAKAPHNSRAHFNLALKLLDAGDTPSALTHLRSAAELAESEREIGRARIVSKLGVVLAEQGDVAAGLPHCEEAARLDKTSGEVQINLGVARALAGDDRGAIAALSRAVEIHPNRADAHFNLGQIAQRAGELPLAERHLSIAQQLEPSLPRIGERLALVRLQLRQSRRATPAS